MADRIGRPRQRIGFPWVAATPDACVATVNRATRRGGR
jgi:hypothetical protein